MHKAPATKAPSSTLGIQHRHKCCAQRTNDAVTTFNGLAQVIHQRPGHSSFLSKSMTALSLSSGFLEETLSFVMHGGYRLSRRAGNLRTPRACSCRAFSAQASLHQQTCSLRTPLTLQMEHPALLTVPSEGNPLDSRSSECRPRLPPAFSAVFLSLLLPPGKAKP